MNNGQKFHQYQQSEHPHVSFLKSLKKKKKKKKPHTTPAAGTALVQTQNVEMVSLCNLSIKEQKLHPDFSFDTKALNNRLK